MGKILQKNLEKTQYISRFKADYKDYILGWNSSDERKYLGLFLKYTNPKNPNYKNDYNRYVNNILSYCHQKRTTYHMHETLDILDEAIANLPHSVPLRNQRANTYYATRISSERALEDIKVSLKLLPKQPKVLFLQGKIYFERQAYEKALGLFKKTLQLDKNNIRLSFASIMTLIKLKNITMARKSIRFLLKKLSRNSVEYSIGKMFEYFVIEKKEKHINFLDRLLCAHITLINGHCIMLKSFFENKRAILLLFLVYKIDYRDELCILAKEKYVIF